MQTDTKYIVKSQTCVVTLIYNTEQIYPLAITQNKQKFYVHRIKTLDATI